MERVSQMLGMSVMSAANGASLGRVEDLLVDGPGGQVVDGPGGQVIAVVVRRGTLASARVLSYEEVQVVGPDAVIARSEDRIVNPREWHERGLEATPSSALKDRRVVTDDGRQLGRIKDVFVDGATGTVRGYEIGSGGLAGLVGGRATLSRTDGVRIGPDAVVVSQPPGGVDDDDEHVRYRGGR